MLLFNLMLAALCLGLAGFTINTVEMTFRWISAVRPKQLLRNLLIVLIAGKNLHRI